MSISSITPYITFAELQALKEPAALDGSTVVAAPTVTQGSTPQTVPASTDPSPLLSALNQTLLQFGLATQKSNAGGASGTASSSATPASAATPSAAQATQNFLGALYQAASLKQAATTALTENNANHAASVDATTAAQVRASYTGTAVNLSSLLQQIESKPSNTTAASAAAQTTESTPSITVAASANAMQVPENNSIATLQANFQDLLNSSSAVNSQAVAAANSAFPTLQTFVQTLASNIPDLVAPVSALRAEGNLIETEV